MDLVEMTKDKIKSSKYLTIYDYIKKKDSDKKIPCRYLFAF